MSKEDNEKCLKIVNENVIINSTIVETINVELIDSNSVLVTEHCSENQNEESLNLEKGNNQKFNKNITDTTKYNKKINRRGNNNSKTAFLTSKQQSEPWIANFKHKNKFQHQKNKIDNRIASNQNHVGFYRKPHLLKNYRNFNKIIIQGGQQGQYSLRSKFFLPNKRPRKDSIIPPTKFLLGGNISDPLNLNSLQNENSSEAQNATQSPITTPPKVEVIIPPNICDPLHLLDPVDSIEYEKQLISPLKRRTKTKNRNRKKKPKRKRLSKSISDTSFNISDKTEISDQNSIITNLNSSVINYSSANVSEENISCADDKTENEANTFECTTTECDNYNKKNENEIKMDVIKKNNEKEKSKDLRLDFTHINENNQAVNNTRKRKISEGPISTKTKLRRLDSLDKIVSPVVPQPGAWKRPPRTVQEVLGARKGVRHQSTSTSETDIVSPSDEIKTIEVESSPPVKKPKLKIEKEELPNIDNNITKQTTVSMLKLPKFKKYGLKYQYGNYDRYRGCDNLNEFFDVRLQVFKWNSHLFRGKDILDIGCNAGHITMSVAKNLAPKTIIGIDIDRNLIYRAKNFLSKYIKIPKEINLNEININTVNIQKNDETKFQLKTESKKNCFQRKKHNKLKDDKNKFEYFPISFPILYGKCSKKCTNITEIKANTPNEKEFQPLEFPDNIQFRTANYILKDENLINNETQQYDVILCLSVTKWIHLNFGDNGLKQAFKRMFNQLRPGGKLILEAQNWASYKKKKNLTEKTYKNYHSIEFYPNKFHEYLLGNEVGFSHSYVLGVPRHLKKGFHRPIQLYAKGDYTPNHARWSDNYNPQTPHETRCSIYGPTIRHPYNIWGCETPYGSSGTFSCRQTPLYHGLSTSQYNPLETDSYLPSYDNEVQNRHYLFASPLYQAVWSPPASLRTSSSHTPIFGSVRDSDIETGVNISRHVYPPNDTSTSPYTNTVLLNSIREQDSEEYVGQSRHVYISYENSSSPRDENNIGLNVDNNSQDCSNNNSNENSRRGIVNKSP